MHTARSAGVLQGTRVPGMMRVRRSCETVVFTIHGFPISVGLHAHCLPMRCSAHRLTPQRNVTRREMSLQPHHTTPHRSAGERRAV